LYEISDKSRTVRNQDGGVVLDVKQGKIFHLNGTASLVWDRLRDGCAPDQIISEICSVFGIPEKDAAADVTEFIAGLEKEGLLIRSGSKESSSVH
jgi:hypothetical protein